MTESEERNTRTVPSEEQVEEEVERTDSSRPAPIDEHVTGQINAAFPDEDRDTDRKRN
jgi:hypothetical protein